MPPQNSSSACCSRAGVGPSETAAEREALDQLFSVTYEELRRLAATVKRGDPNITLSPTALVNEAWLKLSKSPGMRLESPLHFKRIAARAMRQLLMEAARRRHADKRGGEAAIFITFDEALDGAVTALRTTCWRWTRALLELAHAEPRQAAIVESRFFGGLEVSEISQLMGYFGSYRPARLAAAKAWLGHRLRHAG